MLLSILQPKIVSGRTNDKSSLRCGDRKLTGNEAPLKQVWAKANTDTAVSSPVAYQLHELNYPTQISSLAAPKRMTTLNWVEPK